MSDFKARNGVTLGFDDPIRVYLTEDGRNLLDSYNFLSLEEMAALREFFEQENDEGLGRWRWPVHREYVVYSRGDGSVLAVNEANGRSLTAERHDPPTGSILSAAAHAYFEAHPERKPWQDAEPGEVWLLTTTHIDDRWNPTAFTVAPEGVSRIRFIPSQPDYAVTYLGQDATAIKDGRRIWPEDAS